MATEIGIQEELVTVSEFERQYAELRKTERRNYTKEQIAMLPDISRQHPLYYEWQIRKRSVNRLTKYIRKKKKLLNVLEVGCGNGWLSAKIAEIENTSVTGIDVFLNDVKDGESVFKGKDNLKLLFGDIVDKELADSRFDIILFAASLQYFSSIPGVIQIVLRLLSPGGEIHIMDTPFYKEDEKIAAKDRTKMYFESLGFPEMTAYYFHHAIGELSAFKYSIMYDPYSLPHRLLRHPDRFYWIKITG